MKYSIVIPTYNHCDDLLKPCIDSIVKYTDLSNVEVVIVANGCTDNTREYVESLGSFAKLVWSQEAIGYTRATNLGISAALGEYVILMNNDVVLLEQPVNYWINLLEYPFIRSPLTGITGPVKFSWDCGGVVRHAMAFWLVMMKNSIFEQLGLLDEIFSPGMGEDGDFSIKVEQAGYQLTSVPEDIASEFNSGIKNFNFPIWHKGNGTFADDVSLKDDVIQRNIKILESRYGLNVAAKTKDIEVSIIIPTCDHFDDALKPCLEAVLNYTNLENKEVIVVCNGSNEVTRQYLNQYSDKIKYVWIEQRCGVVTAYNTGISQSQGKYVVLLDDDSILMPQEVDSWINILKTPFLEQQMVGATGPFAHEYEDLGFVLHSGCAMYDATLLKDIGMFDMAYHPGYFCDPDVSMRIWQAGYKCIEVPAPNPDKPYFNNMFIIQFPVVHTGTVQTMNKNSDIDMLKKNREILYSRYGKKQKMKYSIVIPTYNHCDDLLKPCIESIVKYTNTAMIEIIVVANGCTDNTREYVESLGSFAKLVWSQEAIGYTRATNLGIQASQGDYVVLLNNDTELLPQEQNNWLLQLEAPFANPKMGLTGPLQLFDNYANSNVLIFFCVMVKRSLFDEIGLLDEIFSPGGGEDIDFTVRANQAGYLSQVLNETKYEPSVATNVGTFPIWHKDNRTFRDIPEYTKHIVKRNGLTNCKRYNRNIKLNLGAGGIEYPGYLSVDFYDNRANVQMDITKLEFEDNSVSEILASHVFEHLNPYKCLDILKDWARVLKPGGKLIMEMPNIEELCRRFMSASTGERYGILNAVYGSVNTTDSGEPSDITSPHLFGWWPQSMHDHLWNAGYTDIAFMDEKIPHPESNFRVEATKPWPVLDRAGLQVQEPATYIEIFDHNYYGIEQHEVEGRVIIDVGANLGMFALRCVELGAKKVFAVEAQPTICEQGLKPNIAKYSNIIPLNYALLDRDNAMVNIINQHVGSKVGTVGDPVFTMTLETLIKTHNIYGNDLALKLDCEGSEFDILMSTSRLTLRKFTTIYIEMHGECNDNPAYRDIEVLKTRLAEFGFTCAKASSQINWNPGTPEPDILVGKWIRVD